MEQNSVDYKGKHVLEWELKAKNEEIFLLKENLRKTQMFIFTEREHSMKLQHDNDMLHSL